MATDRGADVVRRNGKAFARFQWESWSPHGWFDDAVFNAVAESLKKSGLAEQRKCGLLSFLQLGVARIRLGLAPANPIGMQSHATLVIQGGSRPLHRPPASRPSNGSFSFDNFDLKSTRTLLSQLDPKHRSLL